MKKIFILISLVFLLSACTAVESHSATPTVTPTETPIVTPSATPTVTPTETPVVTPSETPIESPTATPTETPTPTLTPEPTPTSITGEGEIPVVTLRSYDEYMEYIASTEIPDHLILYETFEPYAEYQSCGIWEVRNFKQSYYIFADKYGNRMDVSIYIYENRPDNIKEFMLELLPNCFDNRLYEYSPELFPAGDLTEMNGQAAKGYMIINNVMYSYVEGKLKELEFIYNDYWIIFSSIYFGEETFFDESVIQRLLNYHTAEAAIKEFKDSIITVGDKK